MPPVSRFARPVLIGSYNFSTPGGDAASASYMVLNKTAVELAASLVLLTTLFEPIGNHGKQHPHLCRIGQRRLDRQTIPLRASAGQPYSTAGVSAAPFPISPNRDALWPVNWREAGPSRRPRGRYAGGPTADTGSILMLCPTNNWPYNGGRCSSQRYQQCPLIQVPTDRRLHGTDG